MSMFSIDTEVFPTSGPMSVCRKCLHLRDVAAAAIEILDVARRADTMAERRRLLASAADVISVSLMDHWECECVFTVQTARPDKS